MTQQYILLHKDHKYHHRSNVSEATGEKRAKSFLFQSLSMNLQRGNALCVMGTVAHHRKLEEIYNLGTIQTQG